MRLPLVRNAFRRTVELWLLVDMVNYLTQHGYWVTLIFRHYYHCNTPGSFGFYFRRGEKRYKLVDLPYLFIVSRCFVGNRSWRISKAEPGGNDISQ